MSYHFISTNLTIKLILANQRNSWLRLSENLFEIIKNEIEKKGAIPFDRFMNICLYHPKLGYYSQASKPRQGKKGDYFTSVSVGKTFSYLLSFALIELINKLKHNQPLPIVELGAGDGSLAFDIFDVLKNHYPSCCQKINYIAVEKNKWQRKLIREKVKSQKNKKIQVKSSLKEIKSIEKGIIFANECIDSLPVKQVKFSPNGPLELYIKLKGKKLSPCYLPPKNPFLLNYLKNIKHRALIGKVIEVNLEANWLLKKVSSVLKSGYFMIIDYGGLNEEIVTRSPEGTLRGFYNHKFISDLTFQPGESDLTSDVNFSDLIRWSKKLGFKKEKYSTQLNFFSEILNKTQSSTCFQKINPNQLKVLIHPDFLGERFKILTLKR